MQALSITGSPFKIRLKDECSEASDCSGSGYEARRDDAAALFQQLQLIRNENRKRWGELERTNTKNVHQKVEDMLQDFKEATADDDNAKNELANNASNTRQPLKILTNNKGEQRCSKVYGKKKQRLTEQKAAKSDATESNNFSTIDSSVNKTMSIQKQQPPMQPPKDNSVRRQNDYCVSKLSIGISEPTYEVSNYGVMDHSMLFSFATTQREEPDHNFYEDSPTNSTLSLTSLTGGLSVIQECDEEAECDDNSDASSEYVEFVRTSSITSFSYCAEAETASLKKALGPLLKCNSFEGVSRNYYEDQEWKEEEKMCLSGCFFSAIANLFRGNKKNQNCFAPHGCEI